MLVRAKDVLTLSEAADLLHVDTEVLRREIIAGRLRPLSPQSNKHGYAKYTRNSILLKRDIVTQYNIQPRSRSGRRLRPTTFDSDMLTVREAAESLDIPRKELLRRIRRSELIPDGRRSNWWYFYKETVEQLRKTGGYSGTNTGRVVRVTHTEF